MKKQIPTIISLILFVALVVSLAVMFQGTMNSVIAWLLLISAIPAAGALWILFILGSAAIKRHWGLWRTLGLLAGVLCALPGMWSFGVGQFPFPLEEDPELTLLVRVPMDGEVIVIWGGDSVERNHHAGFPDQRWAYDLVLEPALTGSDRLEDYGCFGRPVLAPVDGTVSKVITGHPDQAAGTYVPNMKAPLGNAVWIQPSKGGHLVLAHLKAGSVSTKLGQKVKEGDQLGECGNSGNTSEPHIHMHYQTQDPNEYPTNFALGRPLGFHKHEGPSRPQGGIELQGAQARAIGDKITHRGD